MARLDNAGHTFLLVEQLGGILLAGSVTVADLVKIRAWMCIMALTY